MTRIQRIWHVRIWLALAPLLAAGLVIALRNRATGCERRMSADVPACCRGSTAGGERDP